MAGRPGSPVVMAGEEVTTQEQMIAAYRERLALYREGKITLPEVMFSGALDVAQKQRHGALVALAYETVRGWRNKEVLEVGCGYGEFSVLMPQCRNYTGIDIVPEFVEMANERTKWSQKWMGFEVRKLETYNCHFDVVIAPMFLTGAFYPKPWPGVLYKLAELTKETLIFDCQLEGVYQRAYPKGQYNTLTIEETSQVLRDLGFRDIHFRHGIDDRNTPFFCAASR